MVKDIDLTIKCDNNSYTINYTLDKYYQIPIDSKCTVLEIPSDYKLSHLNSSLSSVYLSDNEKKPVLDILASSIKDNNDKDKILQTAYPTNVIRCHLEKELGIDQQFQNVIKFHAQAISLGGLVTVLAGGVLAALYYRIVIFSKEQKHAKWVMDKSDILTINSTIIIGVLIFLTISSGFEG